MRRVLIVDDDRGVREAAARYLRKTEIEVEIVDGGADAIRRLRSHRYDMILLDLMMPGLSGFSVIEFLIAECPDDIKRTVVMTSRNVGDAGSICNTDFSDRILSKPFSEKKLQAIAKRVMG